MEAKLKREKEDEERKLRIAEINAKINEPKVLGKRKATDKNEEPKAQVSESGKISIPYQVERKRDVKAEVKDEIIVKVERTSVVEKTSVAQKAEELTQPVQV